MTWKFFSFLKKQNNKERSNIMKLSVQSRKYSIEIIKLRKQIIKKERLYIGKEIDESFFQTLYKKYGNGLSKSDFANFILDINDEALERLHRSKTHILQYEYITEEELTAIRNKVIEAYQLSPKQGISYDLLEKMHTKYGSKLSLSDFAKKILAITPGALRSVCYNRESQMRILKEPFLDRKEVIELRKQILKNEHLFIGVEITLQQLSDLYSQYGKDYPTERDFATEVLDVNADRYNKMQNEAKKGKKDRKTTIISDFSDGLIDLPSILTIREMLIEKENLHIQEQIDYERFQQLYQCYGDILPEELFADAVLDISATALTHMKTKGTRPYILTNIAIPDKYLIALRDKIANEQNLKKGQRICLEELNQLYETYGGILSIQQFVTDVLGIAIGSYRALKNDEIQETSLFFHHFVAFRKMIYTAANLQPGKELDYSEFLSVYRIAMQMFPMGEVVFAHNVLGITTEKYYRMKKQNEKILIIPLDIKTTFSEKLIKKQPPKSKNEHPLRKKCERIVRDGYDSPENLQKIDEYMQQLRKEFSENKELNEKDTIILESCMDFIIPNFQQTLFWAQVCVSLRKYQEAYEFLADQIEYNNTIDAIRKQQLSQFKQKVYYTLGKQKALKMLQSGSKDTKAIARACYILEIDVIGIQRQLNDRINKGQAIESEIIEF